MEIELNLTIMSGIEDGTLLEYNIARGDGEVNHDRWTLTIGRRDENDICLRNDTYISRHHANLHWENGGWHLEDCNSTNGTFISDPNDFFNDLPVKTSAEIKAGQLFCVGRTWLCIQVAE